jgi:acetyl-CoA carboxylase carboxyl transferase subunit beta
MGLFSRLKGRRKKKQAAEWERCPGCQEILPTADVALNARVCPACGYHHPMTAAERMATLLDEGSFQELDQ